MLPLHSDKVSKKKYFLRRFEGASGRWVWILIRLGRLSARYAHVGTRERHVGCVVGAYAEFRGDPL